MPKSKEQKILELEQKVKLLEKQVERSDKKAVFFDMMIDMADPYPKKLLARAINRFTKENGTSISSICGLLGFSWQVYYRSLRAKEKKQAQASEVIAQGNAAHRVYKVVLSAEQAIAGAAHSIVSHTSLSRHL